MASQSTFRAIFKIFPKSTKFTSSSGVEEKKFIKVEPPTDKNKVNENKHSCGPWLLNLKNEWKTLSVAEVKQLLLKEIHGSEWHKFLSWGYIKIAWKVLTQFRVITEGRRRARCPFRRNKILIVRASWCVNEKEETSVFDLPWKASYIYSIYERGSEC